MSGEERKSVQRIDGTWVTRAEGVPYGYCHCGCGNMTKIADRTHTSKGHFKGEPYKFLMGHGGIRGKVARQFEERLWERIAVRGPEDCWEWQGPINSAGYGHSSDGSRDRMSHRAAYELTKGPIPDGMVVMHACDNKVCCNPGHLSVGTYADNSREAAERDLVSHGESHSHAVLTEDDVREIRQLYVEGVPIIEMSRRYGVERSTIRNAVHRRTWRRVA